MLTRIWKVLVRWYHQLGSPRYFYAMTGRWVPWLIGVSALLLIPGLIYGLAFAPPEKYQGDSYRIIYIHVPAASVALTGYFAMAVAGVVTLVWRMKMAAIVARSIAPVGAMFTFICLVTGAIWGKPTWGTWWVWDARLTSMLVLLFLYLGVMALANAIPRADTAARATAVLSIVGAVNLPIIKYSVNWWNTLHQPASIGMGTSAIAPEMLFTLLTCMAGAYCLFALLVIQGARLDILERERRSRWVQTWVKAHWLKGRG